MNLLIFMRIILILVLHVSWSSGEIFEECNGIEDQTFVASQTDCRAYIYCTGEDSLSGECDEGQYFDPEANACDDAENVYCALDEIAVENPDLPNIDNELTTAVAQTDITTQTNPPTMMTTASTTATSTTSTATTTITTTPSTTTSSMTTSEETMRTTTKSPSSNSEHFVNNAIPWVRDNCPATDDPHQIVLLAHNQSCSDYYVCYHGTAIEMHCTSNLHFNKMTGQCDYPENVQCSSSDGPIANKCSANVTGFFPHTENCNYFYYCARGFLMVQQCPFFYGWDVEKRACVQISTAKCYNNNNRNSNKNKQNNNNNNYMHIKNNIFH